MKNKNVVYFPYLPYSQIEDNKRYKQIVNKMENDPFIYHKKKTDLINDNNNQELLFFQNEHDKDINSYNSFMKNKSNTIDINARNYLNYISHEKRINEKNGIHSRNNYNNYNNGENINKENYNYFSTLNNDNISSNNIKDRLIYSKKSPTEKNIFHRNIKIIEPTKNNFIAGNVKARRSDITNPDYFNGIGVEIIKRNNELLNYNLNEAERKLKMRFSKNRINDNISISPEKIRNENYYNIGESTLDINPIINKGSYFCKYFLNRKNNNFRVKSDIMI